MDSGNCVCDLCFVGCGCNVECNGYGICLENKCWCDEFIGWCGLFCEVFGCLGLNGKDCSGNGKCDSVNYICICDLGEESKLNLIE